MMPSSQFDEALSERSKQQKPRKKFGWRFRLTLVIVALILCLIAAGGFVVWISWPRLPYPIVHYQQWAEEAWVEAAGPEDFRVWTQNSHIIAQNALRQDIPVMSASGRFADIDAQYQDLVNEFVDLAEQTRVHYGLIHPDPSGFKRQYDSAIKGLQAGYALRLRHDFETGGVDAVRENLRRQEVLLRSFISYEHATYPHLYGLLAGLEMLIHEVDDPQLNEELYRFLHEDILSDFHVLPRSYLDYSFNSTASVGLRIIGNNFSEKYAAGYAFESAVLYRSLYEIENPEPDGYNKWEGGSLFELVWIPSARKRLQTYLAENPDIYDRSVAPREIWRYFPEEDHIYLISPGVRSYRDFQKDSDLAKAQMLITILKHRLERQESTLIADTAENYPWEDFFSLPLEGPRLEVRPISESLIWRLLGRHKWPHASDELTVEGDDGHYVYTISRINGFQGYAENVNGYLSRTRRLTERFLDLQSITFEAHVATLSEPARIDLPLDQDLTEFFASEEWIAFTEVFPIGRSGDDEILRVNLRFHGPKELEMFYMESPGARYSEEARRGFESMRLLERHYSIPHEKTPPTLEYLP